ncbi:zinc finger protein 28 homolog isoform X2 [Artemia franciscana]|uniref:zinc finger protein 28 homolog isoform X2 n=1 Tax=Artemia franciscana TaxID=6661 RepID=UPI0032DB1EFC
MTDEVILQIPNIKEEAEDDCLRTDVSYLCHDQLDINEDTLSFNSTEPKQECDIYHLDSAINDDIDIQYRRTVSINPGLQDAHMSETCMQDVPFKCNLHRHCKYCKDERQHECKVCQKVFSQKRNLTQHMRIHSEEKPHECKICKKRFAHKEKVLIGKHRWEY